MNQARSRALDALLLQPRNNRAATSSSEPGNEERVATAAESTCIQAEQGGSRDASADRRVVRKLAVRRAPAVVILVERLSARLDGATGDAAGPVPSRRPPQRPEWKKVAPGISCKLLATDLANDRVSMLVRLAPGLSYPPHRHAGVEELHLLHGALCINERKLDPGDYSRAEPHTSDDRVYSETGCTCVLITSPSDELR